MAFDITVAIRAALLANASIAALVSTRIYQHTAPLEVTEPYIAFSKVSNRREADMDGDAGLGDHRYQFTIGGSDTDAVNALRDLLVAMNGTEYSSTQGAVTAVLTFFHVDDRDGFSFDEGTVHPSVDLRVWVNN